MSKEGVLTPEQRGILKDMILEYDSRLVSYLQEYDRLGNKDRLYYQFLQTAATYGKQDKSKAWTLHEA